LIPELNSGNSGSMIENSSRRSVPDIIKAAGGPAKIAGASKGAISTEAVYKWPKIGIPDRHWPLVMPLAGASAEEMLKANVSARRAEAIAS
jgi:hypothetical protein